MPIDSTDILICSAGICPGKAIDPKARKLLEETYGFDIAEYQEPDLPRDLCLMDAIVPIGIEGAKEKFPLHRILTVYEKYKTTDNETIEDLKQMMEKIKAAFYDNEA